MEQDATHRARTDALLVVRCQLGERAAFDDLVRRWSEPLHRYALRLAQDPEVARDITQEVWLRVLQGLGRLHDSANFRAWMRRVHSGIYLEELSLAPTRSSLGTRSSVLRGVRARERPGGASF